MTYSLIGKDFLPPDVEAKVTGKAKYAEDFRAEGMLHCRLLTSPMPHARVRNIDASKALAMKGVVAVLTADEVPSFPPPQNPILTNEPRFVGDPILAVAAVDETTAEDAIEQIRVDLQPLPFTVDPLESLYPGGPDARTEGNVANVRLDLQTIKWTARDFAAAGDDRLPMGKPAEEWSYGDLEAGFAEAKLVLDESFVTAGNSHHCMEPRSAMAYWQNGKCYMHGSSQSQTFMVPGMARYIGIRPQDLVYIAEYCGGGFGSKGAAYPVMSIPAHMSRKTGRLHRLGATGLPRPAQDRLSRQWADIGRRRLRGPRERAQHRLLGFPQSRQCDIHRVPTRGDAVAGRLGAHQHAATRGATRARREPDRLRDRADDRQGCPRARHRSPRDPPHQCTRQ
jgi:xanthine dehydrogenase molybdenum-binding subunit